MINKGSDNKEATISFSIIREISLIVLCVSSFILLSKIKQDLDDTNSRLDWADGVKGCIDKYSDLNTKLYRYQLQKAADYIGKGYGCTIAITVTLGLHLIAFVC